MIKYLQYTRFQIFLLMFSLIRNLAQLFYRDNNKSLINENSLGFNCERDTDCNKSSWCCSGNKCVLGNICY